MSLAKIAVTIDDKQLKKIDYYVKKQVFKSRSQAFQLSIQQTLEQLEHGRLARECAKLNVSEEQTLAEENMDEDFESWPKY